MQAWPISQGTRSYAVDLAAAAKLTWRVPCCVCGVAPCSAADKACPCLVVQGAGFNALTMGVCAGRQYIGDMPNSDLRQMMMTVNTNFWGTHVACDVLLCCSLLRLLWPSTSRTFHV